MGCVAVPCASPIDLADNAFRALNEGPAAPVLDLSHLTPELPARAVRLDELQATLLAGASQGVRDLVWAEVVRRARLDETWKLAAVGMAIPALRAAAGSLSRGFDGDREELDAEIIAGFLTHLSCVDIEAPGVITKLRWAAWRAGREVVLAHQRTMEREEEISDDTSIARPAGHSDLVLSRAVEAGAVSAADAELIAATRLDGEDMQAYAARIGASYNAVKIRRQRAEARLVAFVTDTRRPRADETRVRTIRPAQNVVLGRTAELLNAA